MKIFKKILAIVLILLAIFIVISLFLPSDIKVERSLIINAPAYIVFQQVNNFKNWEKWSPWFKMDTIMEKKYSGSESGNGSKINWHSNNKNVGSGSMIITNSYEPDSILIDMNFMQNGIAKTKFCFKNEIAGTKIIWTMNSYIAQNPISKYFGLFIDKMLGADIEDGLASLKKICESFPKTQKYEIGLTSKEYYPVK